MAVSLPNDQDATGRSFGQQELDFLKQALDSGTLTPTKGTQTKSLEASFAEHIGATHAYACTSGTAAVHVAIGAIDPNPGDEIITTPITDMGALSPIVYQGAIPVFADTDPDTGNVTAATIADRITDKTKAIIVTHLFGMPCDMDAIMALARKHNLPVIEDAAQAYGCRINGRHVGSFGDLGCFSFQQGKHMTTGEGGMVVSSDDALARRARLHINKCWPYGEKGPDHFFLALNYRMSELQGAVARAQLAKLPALLEKRFAACDDLCARINDIDGLSVPMPATGNTHAYWRIPLMVDLGVIPGGPVAVAGELRELGIPSGPRYINKPAFQCAVFKEQNTFGDSHWPFTLASPSAVDYDPARFPGVFSFLDRVLVLSVNEGYTTEHTKLIGDALAGATAKLKGVTA